ncbi:hypothetical protein [Klenkia sp. PcliD-1-E]|uniref:hypothetical protein n=1 Tax=Klenkia sp. PcliD-1-E TaxID=2954492 RepID=UPI002097EA37|nr:hypothetical protein [Klenkia sp. PcliD-1-E]MCO7221825.1 hypothetical protein [Klenkia sp. PcliD-1-E]
MTVPAVSRMGSWVLDRRGQGRGVRITRHPDLHAINLSVWRDSVCVGTVHLSPSDAAEVVQALTTQLAQLAVPPPPVRAVSRVDELEARIAQLEQRRTPRWRRALDRLAEVGDVRPFGKQQPPSGPTGVVR